MAERRGWGLWLRTLVGLAALVAVMALAACGDDDSGGDGGGGGADGGGDTSAASAEKVSGKTIGFVEILGVAAIEKRIYGAFQFAAERPDWDVQFVDTLANPSKALGATQNFVNQGVDAIVFNSIPSEWVRPAVKQAKAKGIPTINLVTTATPGVYDADYDEDEDVLTKPLGERLVEDYPDGAKIGLLEANSIVASPARVKALKAGLEGSDVEVVDEADLPEATPQAAEKASVDMLGAHPDLDVIVGIFDQFSPAAMAALKTTRKADVRYYSYYADEVNVPLMKRPNSPFVAVTDSDVATLPFVAVDQLLKHFATGDPVDPDAPTPQKALIVDKDNLPADDKQGPYPFAELAEPFFAEWETEYGLK